jgi:predicted RNase H-like HicB family nuclease
MGVCVNDMTTQRGRYDISIIWSEDDRAYVARVPNLPGCIVHGDTFDEAKNNARIAIKNWLETDRFRRMR